MSCNSTPNRSVIFFLSDELKNYISEIKEKYKKDETWEKKVLENLTSEKIFDVFTLLNVPEKFWSEIGFNTAGLRREIRMKIIEEKNDEKMERASNQNLFENYFVTPPYSPVSLQEVVIPSAPISVNTPPPPYIPSGWASSKYDARNLHQINFQAIFQTTSEARDAYQYLTHGIYESPRHDKGILHVVTRTIISDIIEEGKRFFPNDPEKQYKVPMDILKNAATALIDNIPGLLDEVLTPEQRKDDIVKQKEKAIWYFHCPRGGSRTGGSLVTRLDLVKQSKEVQNKLAANPKKKKKVDNHEIITIDDHEVILPGLSLSMNRNNVPYITQTGISAYKPHMSSQASVLNVSPEFPLYPTEDSFGTYPRIYQKQRNQSNYRIASTDIPSTSYARQISYPDFEKANMSVSDTSNELPSISHTKSSNKKPKQSTMSKKVSNEPIEVPLCVSITLSSIFFLFSNCQNFYFRS